jgi:hypothetical protein
MDPEAVPGTDSGGIELAGGMVVVVLDGAVPASSVEVAVVADPPSLESHAAAINARTTMSVRRT